MKLTLLVILFSSLAHAHQCIDLFYDLSSTNSYKLKWLEQRSQQTLEFRQNQNRQTLARLKGSQVYKEMANHIRALYSGESEVSSVSLDANQSVSLVFKGIGLGTELVLGNRADRSQRTLFSTLDLSHKRDVTAIDFSLSPDKKLAAVSIVRNGSLDAYEIHLIRVSDGKRLGEGVSSEQSMVAWTGNNQLIYQSSARGGEPALTQVTIEGDTVSKGAPYEGELVDAQNDLGLMVAPKEKGQKGTRYLLSSPQGLVPFTPPSPVQSLIGRIGDDVYVLLEGERAAGEIYKVRLGGELDEQKVAIRQKQAIVKKAFVLGERLLVQRFYGGSQTLEIFDKDLNLITSLALPEYASVNLSKPALEKMKWQSDGRLLELTLQSVVVPSLTVHLDTQTGTLLEKDLADRLLTREGVRYKSEIVKYQSDDGTQVPMRLTYPSGIKKDNSTRALINVYGGFGVSYRFYPTYDKSLYDLMLKRGGMIVDLAPRGGNERGERWHHAAILENKIKTLQDVNSAARYLIDNQFTKPEYIAMTGTSNGGFVVAASALLAPTLYGLVIPVNGVQDQLRKDVEDVNFGGWASEYGSDSTRDLDFLMKESPVELISQSLPKAATNILFINGFNDSRVSPAESLKAAYAGQVNSNADHYVGLYSVNKSGHWLAKITYQDLVAVQTMRVIWSSIYQQFGWVSP